MFFSSIIAAFSSAHYFFLDLFHSDLFLGFLFGFLLAVVIVGYTLSIDPRHIPFVLRYSVPVSFEKINERDIHRFGKSRVTFERFVKIYFITRFMIALLLIAILVLVVFLFLRK